MFQTYNDLSLFLTRLTSHSDLVEAEQQAILGLPSTRERVLTNRDFVRLGEPTTHACVLVAGVAGRFGQTAQGDRQITALYFPGDAPDLHSVVLPFSGAALQGLSDCTILRVPQTALRSAAGRFPAIAEALWRDCMVDAAIVAEWVVNIGRRDAQTRLAHLLCEVATRSSAEPVGGEVRFSFPLTQAHIADATGLTPVHVNRTLRALREQGLAKLTRTEAYICDWARLSRVADFDPGYLMARARQKPKAMIVQRMS